MVNGAGYIRRELEEGGELVDFKPDILSRPSRLTPHNSSNNTNLELIGFRMLEWLLGGSDGDSRTAYTMWLELTMTRASRDIFERQNSRLPISRWTAALRRLSLNPWRVGWWHYCSCGGHGWPWWCGGWRGAGKRLRMGDGREKTVGVKGKGWVRRLVVGSELCGDPVLSWPFSLWIWIWSRPPISHKSLKVEFST